MNTNKQIEWTTVKSFATPLEAHLARSVLENEGIEAFLRDEHSIGLRPYLSQALGGVRLDVRSVDLGRARALLEVPAAPAEPKTCPSCGGAGEDTPDLGARILSVLASLLVMIPIRLRRPRHRCQACGRAWHK